MSQPSERNQRRANLVSQVEQLRHELYSLEEEFHEDEPERELIVQTNVELSALLKLLARLGERLN